MSSPSDMFRNSGEAMLTDYCGGCGFVCNLYGACRAVRELASDSAGLLCIVKSIKPKENENIGNNTEL